MKSRTNKARILEELRAIERNGVLTPENVVDAARDPASHLHKVFEWDDGVAAELYRLEQARYLIRFTVVIVDDDKPQAHAYVSLRGDRKFGDSYRSIESVLSNAERRAALLEQALAELQAYKRRYAFFVELADVFAAIDKATAKGQKPKPKPKKK